MSDPLIEPQTPNRKTLADPGSNDWLGPQIGRQTHHRHPLSNDLPSATDDQM